MVLWNLKVRLQVNDDKVCVCVCVCACVRACVRACVHACVFMWFMRTVTNLYNDMGMT